MTIKKFEVFYGGYFAESHEVIFENGGLYYYKDQFRSDSPPHKIDFTEEKFEKFLADLKLIVKPWIKDYYMPVCDGTQWSLTIHTDNTKINHSGSNGFPHNFHLFLKLFRRFTGYRSFAHGHGPNDMFTWGEPLPPGSSLIHLYNRRTTELLRKKRRTVRQLAEFLNFDIPYVRNQLKCKKTFDECILKRIAEFFNVPERDFLYEGEIPVIGANFKWNAKEKSY